MDSQPKSGFPKFHDGDVYIVVSTSKVYQLHSNILRNASSRFRQWLDNQKPVKLTAAARREGHTPWRFHLSSINPQSDELEQFYPIQISESGRFQNVSNVPYRASSISVGGEDMDRHWDWLLGCFYNIPPSLDDSTFAATVEDCIKLVDAAKDMDAVEQVQEFVDLALMRQDEVLWKSIAGNPIEWAKLGYNVRSPGILKEAVIHIVGKWKLESADMRASLPGPVHDLCKKKWDELELKKRAIEIRIAGHYPAFLCRNLIPKPSRSRYEKDIFLWMAISYFRQYIAQAGNDSKLRMADDGGYSFYRKFSIGGNAYLHYEDLQEFYTYFPMSSKARGIFQSSMHVLKEDIKGFVIDLMVVRTHVDPITLGIDKPWLTCVVVEKEDLPWYVEAKTEPDDEMDTIVSSGE